jgi:hypothetical protein
MKLGEFAASFEADGFVFSQMRGGDEIKPSLFTLPWSELRDTADKFVQYCYSDGWVSPRVNWPDWIRSPEAISLLSDADHPVPGAKLSRANAAQLTKLLTALIRNARGSDGYLQAAFDSGLLLGIVRRAKELGE